MVSQSTQTTRKLKSHTKSRAGCKNCKVRKVKCDERKPECKRCQSYGVCCAYNGGDSLGSDIHSQTHRATDFGVLSLKQCSSMTTTLGLFNGAMDECKASGVPGFGAFKMEPEDVLRIERFQTRTVLSIGTAITGKVYQDQIIRLVSQHPYLMHAVMTITCMHDRYLAGRKNDNQSIPELFHYSQAASLFRQKLLTSVPTSDHDGLWATCALLGTIAVFSIEATNPYDAWPMKSSPSDLEWLEVLDGIHTVWGIIKPTRPGSAFEGLSKDRSKEYLLSTKTPSLRHKIDNLPQPLIDLCEVNISSTPDNNPYLSTLSTLAPLLEMACTQTTYLCYLSFTGHMDSVYKKLLHKKDPRALLILAYWYAKLCRTAPWFLANRALIECQSICIYLEQSHSNLNNIQQLLRFPKVECGFEGIEDLPLTPISMDDSHDIKSPHSAPIASVIRV